MKALVLSGGKGTRLRPITHTSAKQLVPVANKPILYYGLESIAEVGITEVGIIVGDTKEEIKEHVGDGSRFGLKVTYIEQEAPLGLAHAVKIAQDFIKDDPFVMYLGDNLIENGIDRFVKEFNEKKPDSLILLAKVPNPSQFGVAELDGDKVKRLVEKPEDYVSDLALVGVYLFTPKIFEAVNNIKPSGRGELEITDAIQYLVETGKTVLPHLIEGWWKDTGKLEDMLEANRITLDKISTDIKGELLEGSSIRGRVQIGKNSKIINSVICGPSVIGDNCVIENSYICPYTSVNDNSEICHAEIEQSIILENSTIKNLKYRLSESLIGRNVTIQNKESFPKSYQIMVGDNSFLGLK